jgi:rRNA maturation protein Nop10
MSEKLFQVPLSQADIAQDECAFSDWLSKQFDEAAEDDEPVLTAEELGRRLELIAKQKQQLQQRRARWLARTTEKQKLDESALQLRILKQRVTREASPLLRIAMLDEAERVRRLARGLYYHGQPCVHCSLTLRYHSNHRCVACVKEKAARPRLKFYEGASCYRCGSTLRFRNTHTCAVCSERRTESIAKSRITRRIHRENRYAALIARDSRFHGSACRVCRATLRYTKSDKCVACDNTVQKRKPRRFNPALQQHRDNRAAAKLVGLRTFEGTACKYCGSRTRYVSNKNCVKCGEKKAA